MSCSSIHSFPGMCSYPAMPLIGPSINVQVLPFNCLCWFWILHWLFWKSIRHQCIPFFFLSTINAVTINLTAILLLSHPTSVQIENQKNAKRTPSLRPSSSFIVCASSLSQWWCNLSMLQHTHLLHTSSAWNSLIILASKPPSNSNATSNQLFSISKSFTIYLCSHCIECLKCAFGVIL